MIYENLTRLISTRLNSPGKTWKMDINGPDKSWKTHIKRSKKDMETTFRVLYAPCAYTYTILASFPLGSQSPLIPILSVLTGQCKTLNIPSDAIPPGLLGTSPLSSSLSLRQHTSFDPVRIIFTLTCPNHRNLPLLVDKPTGSSSNYSLSSIFTFVAGQRAKILCHSVSH